MGDSKTYNRFSIFLKDTNSLYLSYLLLRNTKEEVTKEHLPTLGNFELLTPNSKFTEVNVRKAPSSMKSNQ